MKLYLRCGAAAIAVATAALVAAGCGGGSGASDAAKNAKALDYVPKDALGYVIVNTDFDGDAWKQFDDLAVAFDEDFKSVGSQVEKSFSTDSDDKIDFEKDVEPWLGENAGAAVLSVGGDEGATDAEALIWIEITDRAKFEDFAKDRGAKKDGSEGDFDIWADGDDTFLAVSDDLVITTDGTKKDLTSIVSYDGDSITDAEGVDDVAGEVEGDTLAAFVLSGPGLRAAVKDVDQLESLSNAKELKEFDGLSFGFGAEDDGFRIHGYAGGIGEVKNASNDVFKDLPGTSLLAVGGNDLGGTIKEAAETLGEDNAQVQQSVGALSGALGVDLDDLAEAFSGEFALSIAGGDEVLGQIAGGAMGAAMGAGVGGVDPAAIAKTGSLTLAFEAGDTTAETMDKLVGAVGGLTGAGAAPKSGTSGDFETKTFTAGGLPVTAASSDDVAALSVGTDVFAKWGEDTLGDNEAFKDAWKAADAPDDVAFSFFADFGRIAKVIDLKSGEGVTPGGWVAWAEGDDDNATFDVFMHVDES